MKRYHHHHHHPSVFNLPTVHVLKQYFQIRCLKLRPVSYRNSVKNRGYWKDVTKAGYKIMFTSVIPFCKLKITK